MLDREINQQSTKLPPYFVFCFGITYDCVKRVQASNNTLLDKPVNGVACPSNVESEAPNMRIDIQKRNMQHQHDDIIPSASERIGRTHASYDEIGSEGKTWVRS